MFTSINNYSVCSFDIIRPKIVNKIFSGYFVEYAARMNCIVRVAKHTIRIACVCYVEVKYVHLLLRNLGQRISPHPILLK